MRKPLYPPTPEEAARIHAGIGPRGVDADNIPIGLTAVEKQAAAQPGLPDPEWTRKQMETQPIVSGKAAAVLAAVGGLLGLVAGGASMFPFLPVWAPFALSVLGAVCLWLAGKALPGLRIGGPLVPPGVATALIAASGSLGAFAATLAPGKLQGALLLLASILGGVAGVADVQLRKPTEPKAA